MNVSSGKTIISGGNFEGASYGIVAKKGCCSRIS